LKETINGVVVALDDQGYFALGRTRAEMGIVIRMISEQVVICMFIGRGRKRLAI